MEKKIYVAPQIEIFEVEVEKGFAQSPGYTVPDGKDFDKGWLD